jgi:hypothetical protein
LGCAIGGNLTLDSTVFDFYNGFEGEGEIQFIRLLNDGNKNVIRIWEGYFDDLMGKFEPTPNGWIGLAYYYNLDEGWYEDSPWKIPNIIEALQQFKGIEGAEFRFQESKSVINEICNLLKNALEDHNCVYIAKE